MAGQKEEYEGEETGTQWRVESPQMPQIRGDRILPFWSEDLVEVKGLSSGWLLCFSYLHVESQYLSLGFYYSCYNMNNKGLPVIEKQKVNWIESGKYIWGCVNTRTGSQGDRYK